MEKQVVFKDGQVSNIIEGEEVWFNEDQLLNNRAIQDIIYATNFLLSPEHMNSLTKKDFEFLLRYFKIGLQ